MTGKKYEQLEFDFFTPEDPFAFLGASDEVLNRKRYDALRKREEATNYIHQANAIIKLVMDNIGEGGRDHDKHEFALWGATELLQKSMEMLE